MRNSIPQRIRNPRSRASVTTTANPNPANSNQDAVVWRFQANPVQADWQRKEQQQQHQKDRSGVIPDVPPTNNCKCGERQQRSVTGNQSGHQPGVDRPSVGIQRRADPEQQQPRTDQVKRIMVVEQPKPCRSTAGFAHHPLPITRSDS